LAISLVAVLGFMVTPANALLGVPDDVPGTDVLVPFFYVSMPGFGNENTLVTITDTKGTGAYRRDPITGIPWPDTLLDLHLRFYTIDSDIAFNMYVRLTWFDVWSDNILRIILDEMGPANRDAFRIDTDGDGVPDHWAGYIHAFNNDVVGTFGWDPLISHIYQVFLPAGMAVGYNGVSWEFGNTLPFLAAADPTRQLHWALPPTWLDGLEAFSANALLSSKHLEAGQAPIDANWFRLMPRYYINDAVAESLLIIWLEANHTRVDPAWLGFPLAANQPIPVPGSIHCYFFNEDEDVLSGDIPLVHELNLLNVRTFLPGGLFGGYPWGGWIDITTPDEYNAGWFYPVWDPGTNAWVNLPLGGWRNWIGYSWQRAVGPSAEAWEVIHEMHREAGAITGWTPNFWIPAPWW